MIVSEAIIGGGSSSGSSGSGNDTSPVYTPTSGSTNSGEQINRKYMDITLNNSYTNGRLRLIGNVKSRAGAFTPSYFTFQGIFDSHYNDITSGFTIAQSPASQGTYIPASTSSSGTPIIFEIKTKGSNTIPVSFKIRICLIRPSGYGCNVTITSAEWTPN